MSRSQERHAGHSVESHWGHVVFGVGPGFELRTGTSWCPVCLEAWDWELDGPTPGARNHRPAEAPPWDPDRPRLALGFGPEGAVSRRSGVWPLSLPLSLRAPSSPS